MVKDMTTGKTSSILLRFALPIILSGIFQQLYNMVDSIVVGKFDGVNALAAVGASYPVTMLFISIAMGGAIGCSVVVSQIFGMKQIGRMKTAISTAILSIAAVALVVMLFGKIYSEDIITLLATPAEIFDSSVAYLNIYTYGILFLFLYNITTSIFNGLGDSKTPLYFLIFSSLLNIALDIIFVKYLHMSVRGVAWATFIAQGTASTLALGTLIYRIRKIETDEPVRYYDFGIFKKMVRVAVPSILQFSTVAVGQLMVQALVNGFGEVVISGYSAAIKLDSFFKVALQTTGTALSSFTAQNYGSGKISRIHKAYVSAFKMVLIYCIVAVSCIYLFGDAMVSMFDDGTNGDSVIVVGMDFIKVTAPFYIIFAFMMMGNGILRGTSCMWQFTLSTAVDLIARVSLSYLLVGVLGYNAIAFAIVIGWVLGAILSTVFYKYNKKLVEN